MNPLSHKPLWQMKPDETRLMIPRNRDRFHEPHPVLSMPITLAVADLALCFGGDTESFERGYNRIALR